MLMEINNKPIYADVPAWEVYMPNLPEDSFFANDELWRENNFKTENGGLYQEPTRQTYQYSVIEQQNIIMRGFLDRLITKNVIDIVANLFDTNEQLFYQNYPYPKTKYNTSKDFLNGFIHAIPFAVKDKPSFKLDPHVDNRLMFGNIIYNLTDNKTSTKIHGDNRNVIYEAPLSKGKGIFFLNTEKTLHSYENNTNEDRYAAICNIIINLH